MGDAETDGQTNPCAELSTRLVHLEQMRKSLLPVSFSKAWPLAAVTWPAPAPSSPHQGFRRQGGLHGRGGGCTGVRFLPRMGRGATGETGSSTWGGDPGRACREGRDQRPQHGKSHGHALLWWRPPQQPQQHHFLLARSINCFKDRGGI